MKTSLGYKQSLKKMKPNIYKFGELIKDVNKYIKYVERLIDIKEEF